jgi:hypothetical protein
MPEAQSGGVFPKWLAFRFRFTGDAVAGRHIDHLTKPILIEVDGGPQIRIDSSFRMGNLDEAVRRVEAASGAVFDFIGRKALARQQHRAVELRLQMRRHVAAGFPEVTSDS